MPILRLYLLLEDPGPTYPIPSHPGLPSSLLIPRALSIRQYPLTLCPPLQQVPKRCLLYTKLADLLQQRKVLSLLMVS